MLRPAVATALPALLSLAACGGTPTFPTPAGKTPVVTVNEIAQHIRCEIAAAKTARETNPDTKGKLLGYSAVLDLTLKVENTSGLDPSVGLTVPFSPSGSTLTLALSGDMSGTQTRTFTTTVTYELDELESCKTTNDSDPTFLTGDLGIADTIAAGFSINGQGIKWKDDSGKEHQGPVFGSTVEFKIARSASLGPTVQVAHVKGGAAATAGSTNTNTMLIAFAAKEVPTPPDPPKKLPAGASFMSLQPADEPARAPASGAAAAQGMIRSMRVQNLGLLP